MPAEALYASGAYWDAHEAWEDRWRVAPHGSDERARLAGLIQLCAAAVQAQRGRWRGVATLAVRAERNLAASSPALAAAVRAWAAQIVAVRAWIAPPPI
jgi:predicted metal-dependent hydrolase